jgi:hypothetical protein
METSPLIINTPDSEIIKYDSLGAYYCVCCFTFFILTGLFIAAIIYL